MPPTPTTPPTISGTAKEGQLLTVGDGVWTNSPTSFSRQWQRCDAAGSNPVSIPSATGTTYLAVAADVGKTLRCSLTAYNAIGASAVMQTAQTAVVSALTAAVPTNIVLPVIVGAPVLFSTLSVSNGSWSGSPTSYTYQWKLCDAAGANAVSIVGETAATHYVGSPNVGKTLRCAVTAVNASGPSIAATSAATGVIVASTNPVPHKGISLGGRSVNRSSTDMDFEIGRCADIAPGGVCRIDCTGPTTQLNALVGKMLAQGLKPLLIIGGSGNVLTAAQGTSMATASAQYYGPLGVRLYETPNEPAIHGWTPTQYADCSRAIYDAVKAVNSTYLVAMGAATGGANGGHGVYDFYSVVIPQMQGKYDVFSVHAYDDPLDHWSGGGSQWDATFGHPTFFPDPLNIVSVMRANGGVKPVWSTESGGPVPKYSEAKQATIVTNGAADTRIQMYLVYTLMDDDVPGFGMLRPDRSQRPAYAAFKAAV